MPIVYIITLLCIFLVGCGNDQHNHPDLASGKDLFEHHCSECHNSTGLGKFLRAVPPNKGTKLSAWQVSHKVRVGSDASKMTTFENMSVEESMKISAYLKGL